MTVHLNRVLFDGSETGQTVGEKINDTMEQAELNARVYEFDHKEKVIIPDDSYTKIGGIVKSVSDGLFVIGFTMAHTMNNTTKSPTVRLVINGVTIIEITKESKDKTDLITTCYEYPIGVVAAVTLDVRLEVKKETNTGVCEVISSNLYVEKKL